MALLTTKKIGLLLVLLLQGALAFSQPEKLLAWLESGQSTSSIEAGRAFLNTKIVNTHTSTFLAKNTLDFTISHRFGKLNSGAYELWGLDQSTIRLGLEYGLTKNIMIGVGRSSFKKTYDAFIKLSILRQSSDGSPVSLALFGNINAFAQKVGLPNGKKLPFEYRLSYSSQLILARNFNESFALQLAPLLVHRNYVFIPGQHNKTFALPIGARIDLTKRTSMTLDYIPRISGIDANTYNSLSIGFDIHTGGHVFQLHFTNSQGMVESLYAVQTIDRWDEGDVFFGFNISRTFGTKKKK